MSFLLENKLGPDISQYIYQFTKPKSIFSYRDVLCLKGRRNSIASLAKEGIIYQFLSGTGQDFDYQNISYSDPNLFTKNIGYRGYSLFLGYIDLKFYPDVKGNLKMMLVFDEFPLTPMEIIVLDSEGSIVNCYPLKDNLVLSGVLAHRGVRPGAQLYFYYDIVEKKKLNTLELENWNRLIENSSQFVNTYLAKHLDNKIIINYQHFKSDDDWSWMPTDDEIHF